jgi:hypothetical protein
MKRKEKISKKTIEKLIKFLKEESKRESDKKS